MPRLFFWPILLILYHLLSVMAQNRFYPVLVQLHFQGMKALQAKAEKDRRGRSCYFQKGKAKAGRKCFRFPLLFMDDSSRSADDKADRLLFFCALNFFLKVPYAPTFCLCADFKAFLLALTKWYCLMRQSFWQPHQDVMRYPFADLSKMLCAKFLQLYALPACLMR